MQPGQHENHTVKDYQHHLHIATSAKLHAYHKITSMEKLLPVKTEQYDVIH